MLPLYPAEAGNVYVGGVVVKLSAGDGHTCALLTGGDVRCWGYDSFGQLGYTAELRQSPQRASEFTRRVLQRTRAVSARTM